MKDGNCVDAVRVECIEMAAIFIGSVTHPGEGGAKNNIVTKIVVTFNKNATRLTPSLIWRVKNIAVVDDVPQF